MLRVRSSSLTPAEGGRLLFAGSPFSGLAYRVGDDGIVRSVVAVEEGRIAGESSDWIALPEGGQRVDRAFLELAEDYGPLLFRGAPFTGVAYSFAASGVCLSEAEHAGGAATEVSQREWYGTGEPRELVGGGEYTSWLRDGRLKRRAKGGVIVYNLITRDDGRLAGIVLRDPILFDLGAVAAMTFMDDDFLLIGGAVDAALLEILRDQAGLGAVRRLRLIETGIVPEGVDVIVSLAGLAELWLENNPNLGPAEARRIEARKPGCAVRLETAAST